MKDIVYVFFVCARVHARVYICECACLHVSFLCACVWVCLCVRAVGMLFVYCERFVCFVFRECAWVLCVLVCVCVWGMKRLRTCICVGANECVGLLSAYAQCECIIPTTANLGLYHATIIIHKQLVWLRSFNLIICYIVRYLHFSSLIYSNVSFHRRIYSIEMFSSQAMYKGSLHLI